MRLAPEAGKRNRFTSGDHDYRTKTFRDLEGGQLWWCEVDESGWDWSHPAPEGAEMHGPFPTHEQAEADQRLVLLPDETLVLKVDVPDARKRGRH
jgi:hypothetical protein